MNSASGPLLLLVEDNYAFAELLRLAFAEVAPAVRLECISDGEPALARLRHEGIYAGSDPPLLLLLDLNLSRLHGKEVLAAIRADPELRHLPVLMLTTSLAGHDVLDCYRLGANAFLNKPAGYAGVLALARGVADFWLDLAIMPGRCSDAHPAG